MMRVRQADVYSIDRECGVPRLWSAGFSMGGRREGPEDFRSVIKKPQEKLGGAVDPLLHHNRDEPGEHRVCLEQGAETIIKMALNERAITCRAIARLNVAVRGGASTLV